MTDKNPLDFNWDQKTMSKQACDYVAAVFKEIFNDMPKKKVMDHIGGANDIYLFINIVKGAC